MGHYHVGAKYYSCYGTPQNAGLMVKSQDPRQIEKAKALHEQLKKLILSDSYSCLGAKSVFRNNTYRFGCYGNLGSKEAALGLQYDLTSFLHEVKDVSGQFVSFVAAFSAPVAMEEMSFEEQLWKQLDYLHQLDHCPWDSSVSSNPEDANFGFSFAGCAFFVVGLHQNSTRFARQFKQPVLVFNIHSQFELLRETGKYDKMKQAIRLRDQAWQGFTNPMLSDFGLISEARQYSGRAVSENWQCPFHVSKKDTIKEDIIQE